MVSIVCNIITVTYITKNKVKEESTSTLKEVKQEKEVPETTNILDCLFMKNPIDQFFSERLRNHKSEIEYEMVQRAYASVWEAEYKKILGIIQNKCSYSEDKEIFERYIKESKEVYGNSESALLAVMLDNFNLPEGPEKHSYGQGTTAGLKMYQGMMDRNACVMFIPYLEDYTFPDVKELEESIKRSSSPTFSRI